MHEKFSYKTDKRNFKFYPALPEHFLDFRKLSFYSQIFIRPMHIYIYMCVCVKYYKKFMAFKIV